MHAYIYYAIKSIFMFRMSLITIFNSSVETEREDALSKTCISYSVYCYSS